jgi:quercetin dioxygenase-like cupin family protein
MSQPSWIVRESDVAGYSPANHSGTLNRRLIGRETVGARHVEVVLGVIEKNQGALPHAHPGMEQVCYLLSGSAIVEVDGERGELQAGDCCYFAPDKKHVFTVISDIPARVLVIYSPPYEENSDRVVR